MFCPKDLKPCIDDLCYGGGCMERNGAEMLYRRSGCKALISEGDMWDCTCELYDEDPANG